RTSISSSARATRSTLPSNSNSKVCTPTTIRPCSRYFSAHARTYGSVRIQLMHVYVPKLTSTTWSRRSAGVSGVAGRQAVAPSQGGRRPSTGYSLRWRSTAEDGASAGRRRRPVGKLPIRPHEVAGVAVGVLHQVVLVLGLGLPERTGRRDLGDHLAGP